MANKQQIADRVEDLTRLNTHDLKVLLFHVIIVGIQAALIQLGIEKPEWAIFVNPIAEYIRRTIV